MQARLAALIRVKATAELRAAVEEDYVTALRDARTAGCSFESIGDAAGVTKQTIHQRLTREA